MGNEGDEHPLHHLKCYWGGEGGREESQKWSHFFKEKPAAQNIGN